MKICTINIYVILAKDYIFKSQNPFETLAQTGN